MKGKFILYALLGTILFVLTNCTKKYDYTDVIPKDVSVVCGIDLKRLYAKSGLSGSEAGEKILSIVKSYIEAQLSDAEKNKVDEYMKHPEETGLCLTDKIYAFAGNQSKSLGLIVRVAHKEKLRKLIEKNKQTILEKKDGFYYGMDANSVFIFDDKALLVLLSSYPSDESLKNQAFMLMQDNTKKEKSRDLLRMIEAKDDVTAYIDMNFISSTILSYVTMGLPADFRLQDIKFMAALNFEKGKVAITVDNLTENPEIAAFFERQKKASSSMTGRFMDMFPSSTLLWACANLKGEDFLKMLQEIPHVKRSIAYSDIPVDMERVIASINGQVSVGLHSIINPKFTVYAEMKDEQFLSETLNELIPFVQSTSGMASIKKVGDDLYLFQAYPGIQVWFGMYRNIFFVSNDQPSVQYMGKPYTSSLNMKEWASHVAGNNGFIALNCEQLRRDANYVGIADALSISMALTPFDYIEAYSSEWKKVNVNVVLKGKERNLLEQIINLVSKFKL